MEQNGQIFSPSLPASGFVRDKQILQFIPVSRSSWWQGVKDGRYPKPIKLSKRVTVWRVEDIRALIEKIASEG